MEVEFAEHNCAITPPESWTDITADIPSQPDVFAVFQRPDKRSILILMKGKPEGPAGPLDDDGVAHFEKGLENSPAGKRITGKFIELAGLKAYERTGKMMVGGQSTSTMADLIPTLDHFYCLQVVHFDGEAAADPEIRKTIESFRFLKAPAVATGRPNAGLQNSGYLAGKIVGALLIVGLIILGIRAIGRRNAAD